MSRRRVIPRMGLPAEARAKCRHCDSALFALPAGRFAIVHLTWTRRTDLPPFSRATVFTQWPTALAAMAEHGTQGHDKVPSYSLKQF